MDQSSDSGKDDNHNASVNDNANDDNDDPASGDDARKIVASKPSKGKKDKNEMSDGDSDNNNSNNANTDDEQNEVKRQDSVDLSSPRISSGDGCGPTEITDRHRGPRNRRFYNNNNNNNDNDNSNNNDDNKDIGNTIKIRKREWYN